MNILVIGEYCTDIFWYGDVTRICPEGPVPVFKPNYKTQNPGMAGNVVENLKVLGVTPDVKYQKNSIQKIRYISDRFNQIIVRVDTGDDDVERINMSEIDEKLLVSYDMIILSDYNKGFLHEDDIKYISSINDNVIIDTKKKLGNWCDNLKFIKLNRHEYNDNLKWIEHNPHINEKLLITLDKDGCLYNSITYGVPNVQVEEITGAGDTFVATFVYEYLRSTNIINSIKFANTCAVSVVQKRGVVTI